MGSCAAYDRYYAFLISFLLLNYFLMKFFGGWGVAGGFVIDWNYVMNGV